MPLLQEAAGAPLEAIVEHGTDPWESLQRTVATGKYREVIISTLPLGVSRWLERDLPSRARKLGIPVTVVTAAGRRGQQVAPPAIG